MNRRKGIIGALAVMAASFTVRAQPIAATKGITDLGLTWRPSVYLGLDNFADNAIKVSFKGETIEITCEEIMVALRPEKGTPAK